MIQILTVWGIVGTLTFIVIANVYKAPVLWKRWVIYTLCGPVTFGVAVIYNIFAWIIIPPVAWFCTSVLGMEVD